MPDILHLIAIKAPPATVYAALTEQKGFAGWWTTDTKAAPEVGAVDQFRSAQRGGSDMKVAELVPRRRVRWQCLDGAKELIGAEVTFHRRQEESATILLLAQRGWREPVEFMHYCNTKWAVFLLSLKSLCETGKGAPVAATSTSASADAIIAAAASDRDAKWHGPAPA